MTRNITLFLLLAIGTFIIDHNIKLWAMDAVDGVEYAMIMEGSCINLELYYNKGVAFSMLSFLGDNLKWVQLVLVISVLFYLLYEGYLKQYALALGLIVGGAFGNIYDRFTQEGVVDYIAWHCGFDFAIFNYADVMIDLGVAIILLQTFLNSRKENTTKD
jgi:signal peptidase II